MKKIILICCFIFLFISIVTSKYKSYSYSRFRWVDFECAFFKLECIWYNDNLILRNLDSELEMEVILLEDGVIILRIIDHHSYLFSMYEMMYLISNKQWMTEEEWVVYNKSIGRVYKLDNGTSCISLDNLKEYEHFRKEFEEALNHIEAFKYYEKQEFINNNNNIPILIF